MKPTFNRVLVELPPKEEKTDSGLFLSSEVREKYLKGMIKAVGTDIKDEPMEMKVGQVVYFAPHSGIEIGDRLRIINQREILAVDE